MSPATTVIVAGSTPMVARAPGTISTIAVPMCVPDWAVTVPVPVVVAAVNKPEASIVPMPPVTVHVKFAPGIVFPKRSFAAAPKAIVAPAPTLATPGDRST